MPQTKAKTAVTSNVNSTTKAIRECIDRIEAGTLGADEIFAEYDRMITLMRISSSEAAPKGKAKGGKRNPSRADRYAAAIGTIGEAKGEIESLKEELEQWKENLPENMQDGNKAQELESAIDELDGVISSIDDIEGASPEFPGMMG